MVIYRCKNCGQLVEPERNRICPACRMDLAGNMIKKDLRERRHASNKINDEFSRIGKYIKKITFRFAIGFLFLIIYFKVFIPNYVENAKNTLAKNQSEISSKTTKTTAENEIQNKTKNKTDSVIKPEQSYFIRAKNLAFSSETLTKIGEHKDSDILTFKIKEYLNGDIWINEKNVVFIPLEKVKINEKIGWLLLPETHSAISSKAFPNAYDETSNVAGLLKSQYDERRNNIYAYFMNPLMNGEVLDAIFIIGWNSNQLKVLNVKFHYEFDEYKTIQTSDGIVYEFFGGERSSNFMDIPHTIFIDQDDPSGVTTMYSELQLNN